MSHHCYMTMMVTHTKFCWKIHRYYLQFGHILPICMCKASDKHHENRVRLHRNILISEELLRLE